MFENRQEAGLLLAKKLKSFSKEKNLLVLSLVRGGVVLGKIISDYLKCPMDILVVKKIGLYLNTELAIGAVAPKDTVYWNKNLSVGLNEEQKENLKAQKLKELRKQEIEVRGGKKPIDIIRKSVILVDDGVATGATVIAAAKYLKKEKAAKMILATPIIEKDTLLNVKRYFDSVVALKVEYDFFAVGQFYRDFPQIENSEVVKILKS